MAKSDVGRVDPDSCRPLDNAGMARFPQVPCYLWLCGSDVASGRVDAAAAWVHQVVVVLICGLMISTAILTPSCVCFVTLIIQAVRGAVLYSSVCLLNIGL